MNYKSILVFTCLLSLVLSCNSSDGIGEIINNQNSIGVEWDLVNISGGLAGVNNSFNRDIIVWTFNASEETIIVENNSSINSIYDGLDSGTYTFTIEGNDINSFIIIDGIEFGEIIVTNNEFTIDQNNSTSGIITDGFILRFVK